MKIKISQARHVFYLTSDENNGDIEEKTSLENRKNLDEGNLKRS